MKRDGESPKHNDKATRPGWCKAAAKYARADCRKATLQIIGTLTAYFALLAIMIYTVKREWPYWITLALCIPTAAMLTRIFIIFHDCCHKSLFPSRRANTIFGYITGIVTLTPYEDWWHAHAQHHATFGDLDRRGVGDIRTLTTGEYMTTSPLKRLAYRLYRNPLVMFGLGPSYLFFASFRYPQKGAGKRQRTSVLVTDLAILIIIVTASLTIGLGTYLLAQLPPMIVAATAGIWLFYVQHQFEGVRWTRHKDWDRIQAALEGSSYYKLPKVLQWITCNIGFHHIHHIDPRIPNYNLQRCYEAVPELQEVKPLTICRSLKSLRMNLWDEQQQKLVSFRSLRGNV